MSKLIENILTEDEINIILNDIYKTNKKKLWSGGLMRCMQGGINMGVGFFAVQYICKILSCSTYFD